MAPKRPTLVIIAFLYVALRRVLELVALISRGQEANEIEILVLRHQLAVLRRQVARPELSLCDSLLGGVLRGRGRLEAEAAPL